MRFRWSALLLAILALAVVWCGVLPRISAISGLKEQIAHERRQGVNPAAMYYTDLEAMSRIRSRIEAVREAHPTAFWRPGRGGVLARERLANE